MKCLYSIDWLEVFCIEENQICDEEYFRRQGFRVIKQEYGTRLFSEILDLVTDAGDVLYHICRKPYSRKSRGGVMDDHACTIKVGNRLLYKQNPVQDFIMFLELNGYKFKNLSRVDLCCDLQYFKCGLAAWHLPKKYFDKSFLKVNQPEFNVHGTDRDGAVFHSIMWGSKSSAVHSRMYDKTKELRDVKDKPYIRDAWEQVGFDPAHHVWRVEFEIRQRTLANKKTGEIKDLSLRELCTYQGIVNSFSRYADHYFQWKKNTGVQKKNCPLIDLFDIPADAVDYHPVRLTAAADCTRGKKILVGYLDKISHDWKLSQEDLKYISGVMSMILSKYRLVDYYASKFLAESKLEIDLQNARADERKEMEEPPLPSLAIMRKMYEPYQKHTAMPEKEKTPAPQGRRNNTQYPFYESKIIRNYESNQEKQSNEHSPQCGE